MRKYFIYSLAFFSAFVGYVFYISHNSISSQDLTIIDLVDQSQRSNTEKIELNSKTLTPSLFNISSREKTTEHSKMDDQSGISSILINVTGEDSNQSSAIIPSYVLAEPEESKKYVEEHARVEFCLTFIDLIEIHGSLETAAIVIENQYGDPKEQTLNMYKSANKKCENLTLIKEQGSEMQIDNLLIKAIKAGNEAAELKYAAIQSQRSFFGSEFYTSQKRAAQNRSAIDSYLKYAKKGHHESMLMAAFLLTDSVNYPETYDLDLALKLIHNYQEVSGKDMTKFIESIN